MLAAIAVAAAVVAGLVDAWGTRYSLNPDGISYVEMAQHAIANGRIEFVNGYWSPGYPILLLPVLRHVRASSVEFVPALHIVNLLLYFTGLALFLALLRRIRPATHSRHDPLRYASAFGAAAFALIALQGIDLWLLSPDVAVLVVIMLAAICTLAIERRDQSWRWAVALGVTLGMGYWIKAILLPLGAVLLALLLIRAPRVERARAKIVLAGLIFLAICAPLAVMVSERTHHATIGDVGRLNVAWQVDGVTPYVGWLGDSTGRHGRPIHPPRVLMRNPLTLEFATPLQATYPLWYDPSYWYAGVHVTLDIAGEWRAFRTSMHDLGALLLDQWVLFAAIVAGFAATRRRSGSPLPETSLTLVVWAVASTAVYATVHIESRYLAGFITVIVAVAVGALQARVATPWLRRVIPVATIAMLASVTWHLVQSTGGFRPDYRPDYMRAADTLHQRGVRPGDRVAGVGDAFEQYAAFASHVTIAAQVVDSAAYWALTPGGRDSVRQDLRAVGIRALLANNVPAADTAEGWHLLWRPDSTNLAMRLLAPRETCACPAEVARTVVRK